MIIGLIIFLLFGVTHVSYGIDVYNEFLCVFFFTFNLYYIFDYLLDKYSISFNNIEPKHKKMYVIKNYIKSLYLALLCLTLPYYITGQYNILFIKRCCMYYMINDLVGLILVKKLPTTTIIHHSTTSICGLFIFTKKNDNLDILTLLVMYAIFSSITFLVNFYLGYRVHSSNNYIKYYVSLFANYIYIISCTINWIVQLYLFYGIIWTIPFYHTILYLLFLYSVVKDDLILMRWLYNDQIQYKNNLIN
jgi:hypothetical protein